MKRIKSYEQSSLCYLVATPIGNLQDFSSRGKEVLSSVDIIACEDTRTTASLLSYYNIKKTLISYHEHNEQNASQKLLELLKEGKKIAIVSDAGYPGISDPGEIMVKHCIENNIPVSIIPPRLYGLMPAVDFIEDAEDIHALWKAGKPNMVTFDDEPRPLTVKRTVSHRRKLKGETADFSRLV